MYKGLGILISAAVITTMASRVGIGNIESIGEVKSIRSIGSITSDDRENIYPQIYPQIYNSKLDIRGIKDQQSFNNALGIINSELAVDASLIEGWLLRNEECDGGREVFLTFDDGPSVTITPKVLDILKEYGVKATFFQCGEMINLRQSTEELVKRVHDEGHSIGNHFYIHDIVNINSGKTLNTEYCKNQIIKNEKTFKEVLGEDFTVRIMRMPGGYASKQHAKLQGLQEFETYLKENNIYNIEWNSLSGDSDGTNKNKNQLIEEVKKTSEDKRKVIVLMHDTYGKEETVKALPEIIEYFKNQGYEFKVII